MDCEVVGGVDVGLSGIREKPLGMAEFVKLLPGVPSEALLLGYCGVLTSHYSAVTAVAELAREKLANSSLTASSVTDSAVDTVSETLSSESSREGGSVSAGSSASTGKQARKARRRLKKSRKIGPSQEKEKLMSSTNWRSKVETSKMPVSSARSSVLSARSDESEAQSVMRRKHDAVVARGQGFCYLYAVRDYAMAEMASHLGPDPLFSDLLVQPADRFESVSCLAALRVDVSSGNGHLVSSERSGLTRFWTLCCSANCDDFAVGSLGRSTKGYVPCGAGFVRDADFRLGASTSIQGNLKGDGDYGFVSKLEFKSELHVGGWYTNKKGGWAVDKGVLTAELIEQYAGLSDKAKYIVDRGVSSAVVESDSHALRYDGFDYATIIAVKTARLCGLRWGSIEMTILSSWISDANPEKFLELLLGFPSLVNLDKPGGC